MAAAFFWRAAVAWWFDDIANLALAKGDAHSALVLLDRGLAFAPRSSLLLEDRGRAILEFDPAVALQLFKQADCGSPCVAEEGDAQSRLGRADAAVSDYLRAKAVARLNDTAMKLMRGGRYREAIALERTLIARLPDNLLYRADLASAYGTLGRSYAEAQSAQPERVGSYKRLAIEAYRRASDLAPLNENYLLLYGFAQLDWGDAGAARSAFRRLLALHPSQADAVRAMRRMPHRPVRAPSD